MPDPFQLCPACGMPLDADAAFCGACGAELYAEGSGRGGAGSPSEPRRSAPSSHAETAEVESHAESAEIAEDAFHAESAETAENGGGASSPGEPPLTPASPAFVAASRPSAPPSPPFPPIVADPAEAVPFRLEWDEARRFIEGVQCAFSFRVRSSCRIARLGFRIYVDGEALPSDVLFSGVRAGEERSETIPFVPRTPGQIVVGIRGETVFDGGAHESFVATGKFTHDVDSFKRFLSDGNQNISIDIRDNDGIIRLDDLKLPKQAITDLKKELDEARASRGRFRAAGFAPDSIRRERAILRTGAGDGVRELLVVPGTDCVTFGTSSRADVGLLPEASDGSVDERRAGFISGVHVSVQCDRSGSTSVRNGGPGRAKDGAKAPWRASTNGATVNGETLGSSPFRLQPGCGEVELVLAPYVSSGGALALCLEPRGWDDPASASCDWRKGSLASLLVRCKDNPHKAVLVVWGAAALDPVLGTSTGCRVASLDGRLFLVDRSGRARRVHRLVGTAIPGTSFTVS